MSLLIAALGVLLAIGAGLFLFTRRVAAQVESKLGPSGQFIDVPGARLHYLVRGNATADRPPVVMLHGLGGQLHHFGYALLDDLARDTLAIALDRPGSGYSSRTAGCATTLEEQADAIVALLDSLAIRRALLVGHSLGGALSLTLAVRHPERVAGLALIAPLTHYSGRLPPVFRGLAVQSDLARRGVAWLLAVPMFLLNRKRVMPMIFGPEQAPPGYATRAGGLLSLRPSQYIGAAEDLGALGGTLPKVETDYPSLNRDDAPPIHVLYGREDLVLNCHEQGEAFAGRIPRCRLSVVPGGHMLPLTQPDLCARFIREALERARA